MCPLYLATCLSSPPLILAGGAGLPERGGGSVHLDPGLTSGRVETERARAGATVPSCVPSGRSQGLSLSFAAAGRGEAEASGAKTLGEEDSGAPASPTKAWAEVSGLMFN